MSWTVARWAALTLCYAYAYVVLTLRLPDLVGYEAEWSWQLFFFGVTQFPYLLTALFLLIWFEHSYGHRAERPKSN